MSRLFVIDPVCAMEYGHSLNALKYFTQMAAPYFDEAMMVASRHLPGETEEDGIERFFEFHYGQILKIERRPANRPMISAAYKQGGPRSLSAVDFSRLLNHYQISQSDTLLFPSIDYYAAVGILAALSGRHPESRPRLLIRLIGVMEAAAIDMVPAVALNDVIARLKSYEQEGGVVTLCTETPKYARKLSGMMGYEIMTVPYFSPEITALDLPKSGPITFLAGGSARQDKGFFRLKPIIDQVHDQIDAADVRFIIQGLPDDLVQKNLDYLRRLYALPNTEVLPGQISYQEIKRSFAESHVSLMPYDQSVYEMRGSAMLMESMLFERMVICQAGTGFADQARLYRAGDICVSDADFADVICTYARMSPDHIREYAGLARKYYLKEVAKACKIWISGAAA